jgi:hypothetical protein
MHMPPPSAEETARAIEIGHEPSTVSIKGLAWFFVCFFGFAAIVHLLVWWMYSAMLDHEAKQDVPRSVIEAGTKSAPEPRLQPTLNVHERTEPEDLALMKGRNNLEFYRRGWITDKGEFRIPDEVVNKVAGQK